MHEWTKMSKGERARQCDERFDRMSHHYREAKAALVDARDTHPETIVKTVEAWADTCAAASSIAPHRGADPRERTWYQNPNFEHNYGLHFRPKLSQAISPMADQPYRDLPVS